MEITQKDLNTEFTDQLNTAATKALKSLIEAKINLFVQLSEELVNEISDFNSDMQKSDELNISGYLYSIFKVQKELLERLTLIREEINKDIKGETKNLTHGIFGVLQIDPKELESKGGKSNHSFSESLKILFYKQQIKLGQLFSKKKFEISIPGFLLAEVIAPTITGFHDQINLIYQESGKLMKLLYDQHNNFNQQAEKMVLNPSKASLEMESVQLPTSALDQITQQKKVLLSIADDVTGKFCSQISQTLEQKLDLLTNDENNGQQKPRHTLKSGLSHYNNAIKKLNLLVKEWGNTILLYTDNWILDVEISNLKISVLKHSFDFTKAIKSKYIDRLAGELKIAKDQILGIIKEMEIDPEGKKDFNEKLIDKIRTEAKRKLRIRMVPNVRKIILDSSIPAEIDDFEKSTESDFRALPNELFFSLSMDMAKPTPSSDLGKISPFGLVSFEMMPEFQDQFPLLKQAFIQHLQSIQNSIEEIPGIIDFNLSSAINYFQEKDNNEEALKIGYDGIKRASAKLDEIEIQMDDFYSMKISAMQDHIKILAENLTQITDNENAFQIKMRITKAMAIRKSKEIRIRIFNKVKDALPWIVSKGRVAIQFIYDSSVRIGKQFSLDEKKAFIATDVSDYLSETEKAINRLPFIYQKLFQIEPLSTFEVFEGKEDEIEKLKRAYFNWKEEKFAPLVLIGEKGWGKSTLLNRFTSLKITSEPVTFLSPGPEMESEAVFEEIKKAIDNQSDDSRHIIILDGLERLFEARINGFEDLMKFLQLISETSRQIFWMIACHSQSWDYLDKSFNISDYFAYHVRLSAFDEKQLKKIIEKRHNFSGYQLQFLPEVSKKSLINFKKSAPESNQEELSEVYFESLCKFIKGNISQAFLLWMRSTAKVSEDTVFIGPMNDNLNIMDALSDEKLLVMKNIVIHNSLTAGKHARLFRMTEDKSRLQMDQLLDDGLLIKKENVYNINTIIYRQVVEHLFKKNILH